MELEWVLDINTPKEPLVKITGPASWRRASLGALPEGLYFPLSVKFVSIGDNGITNVSDSFVGISVAGMELAGRTVVFASNEFALRGGVGGSRWDGTINLHTIELGAALNGYDAIDVIVEVRGAVVGAKQWIGTMCARIERKVWAGDPPSVSGIPRYYTASECDSMFATNAEFDLHVERTSHFGVVNLPEGATNHAFDLSSLGFSPTILLSQVVPPNYDAPMITTDVVVVSPLLWVVRFSSAIPQNGYKLMWRVL